MMLPDWSDTVSAQTAVNEDASEVAPVKPVAIGDGVEYEVLLYCAAAVEAVLD